MILKKILHVIAIIWGFIQTTEAIGTMTSVYLNPVGGNDTNAGTLTYPVQSWDKALQLAADNATIYLAWGAVPVTSGVTVIDGNQYGAVNITVSQNPGYTGGLFAIADGATGTFSNITLKGSGSAHALITINSGGTLTIGSSVGMADGVIAMDGRANPINLTAPPSAGVNFPILTTYQNATDEGRAIVNAGSVSNPLQYFTLMAPVSTAGVSYELDLDGTVIRLYERPVTGIYLDPLSGNDAYSGAKSNRPVKTLARAMSIWDDRSPVVPDIAVHILTRVTLTENQTLDNGIKFKRFTGDSDRSATMTDYLFVYTGYQLTINDATIDNTSTAGTALYSESSGTLIFNDGATLTSANTSNIIYTNSYGTTTINEGASIIKTSSGSGYCIYSNSYSHLTMNGGTIANNGSSYCIYSYSSSNITIYDGTINANGSGIYKNNGTLTIYGGTFIHGSGSYFIYNYSGTATIHDCTITTRGTDVVYNYYGTMTINDCHITNERTSTGYTVVSASSGNMTINGGTINAGLTTGVYNTSSSGITLNKADITSSNTTNGTVYSSYTLRLDGENVNIHGGIIYFNTTALESYYIMITSPTVTQDYTLRIANNAPYTALVRSTPSIDLGLYESKFTLEPKDGYLLAAYANKGAGDRNLVLYNPNGVYVNDYTGNDTNTGASPASPVKTLANASTKTTASKTLIYICDSTLTIGSAQDISQPAIKDTITSFMFRTSAYLMRITTGGSLTLGNVAVYTASAYVSRYIQMDAGTLTLNNGSELMTYGKYGVYQTGGDVVMNSGSLIKSMPTTSSISTSTYGIYLSGSTATLTLESGSMIKDQYYGIRLAGTNHVEIKDSAVISYTRYPIEISGAGILNIGKARLESTNSGTSNYPAISAFNGITTLNGTLIQNCGYRALTLSGANAIVNMNDGQIINNGVQGNYNSTTYQGAVHIAAQATFNMHGGLIAGNNIPSATNNEIFGEQVYITTGGKMNFTGGTIAASGGKRNAIYVHTESTSVAQQTSRLTLSNAAVLDSGYIYCRNTDNAPVALSESLSAGKIFNINLGDNMAGCTVVDGTFTGYAASLSNFVLNPELTTLSLVQSGSDIVVGSTAIYLDGTNGMDTNDGSSAALAVKTFKRARERLQATNGDVIIVVGAALLANADEISNWDLSFNPNAAIKRGLGYTGYLVNIASGKTLTLSDITIDGSKDNFVNNTSAAVYNYYGTLTINPGTIIKDNRYYGIYSYYGTVYMNGGSVQGHTNYGIYSYYGKFYMTGGTVTNNVYGLYSCSTTSRSDEFIMTGGSITENTNYGVYNLSTKYIRLSGGEISKNGSCGIFDYSNHPSGVLEISGTAKITENRNAGIYPNTSSYYIDSLIISGGEISNNTSAGAIIYANHVSITGGAVRDNSGYGMQISASSSVAGTSFSMTDGTISNNAGYGMAVNYFRDFSMTGGTISNNTSNGMSVLSPSVAGTKYSMTGGNITGNKSNYGLSVSIYENISIENVNVSDNTGYGIQINNGSITLPGVFTMTGGTVNNNTGYGLYLATYLTYAISGDVQITNNRNSGIYSNSLMPSSISGDVLIKGNRANYGGGLYVNQGTVNVFDNVIFEADTCTFGGGAIYVTANGNAVIGDAIIGDTVVTGNVQIRDCRNTTTSTSTSYGGGAIHALGRLSMTGGSITGCEALNTRGTVYVSGTNSNVNLTRVEISGNTARYGGAVYVHTDGKITLDSDTIIGNTSTYLTSYATPVTGDIHIAGGATGRLSLRDKCSMEGDFYLASAADVVYIDEALLNAPIGSLRLLGYTTNGMNNVMLLGTVVASPNATTVTDASQFLSRFTLMNANTGRGLDKGGADDKHIMIVNQFFIDGTCPDGGNGANPLTAFNKLSDLVSKNILTSPYTTVWVSGPVTTTGTDVLPSITTNNVNFRRYTGFAVAAQPLPAYDSVMFTINPGASLTIRGGNSAANRFTISGEGGSGLTDASIFKNNGTLTIGGYTHLYFNPTGGAGGIYQNGVLNLSGNVEFELYSTNTVYLPANKVINITDPFAPVNPIGITVETSPANTQIPGRIVATGTTANVTPGMEDNFYNELALPHLPIGRSTSGTTVNLMFYIADRNVAGVPIYTSLQDAFEASVSANNDEVRLYGATEESVLVDKTLRYNSQGFSVDGSFTLDSVSTVQLLDDLVADTLYIRANVFSTKSQLDRNGHAVTLGKVAYFDLRLPENASMSDWYPVNLPFDADVSSIRDASDTTVQILYLRDYAIAAFDGQRRASYGVGNQPGNPENDWRYFTESRLRNGTGYMVTTHGIRTLRFQSAGLSLFSNETVPMTYYVGAAGGIHQGLNYIAQPLGVNSTIGADIPSGGIVQVSESLSSDRIGGASYVAKAVGPSLVVSPYTNYFYQTNATGTVSYGKSSLPATVRSGRVEDRTYDSPETLPESSSSDVPSYYEMRIYDGVSTDNYDALFVSASEYASEDRYEIGRDVIKMGTVGSGLQIWSPGYETALCATEVLFSGGRAEIPMYVHTPVSGREYVLRLENAVNYNGQLWLCRDKKLVQNLTEYPDYVIEGTGGTSDEYSLRLLSGTAFTESLASEAYVYTEKNRIVLSGLPLGVEYLIYDMSGRLFSTGKSEGVERIGVYAMSGVYVVQINEKTYKVVVK